MEKTEKILSDNAKIDGLFCTGAAMGLGAIEQVQGHHSEDIAIIAVDTQDDALNALRTGRLSALITQDGYEMGYLAVLQMTKQLNGEKIEQNSYIENIPLTRYTVDSFIEENFGEGATNEGAVG